MTANEVLARSLRLGAVVAAGVLVIAVLLGWWLGGGWDGVWAAVLAVALTVVFLGLTAVSILVANRFAPDPHDLVRFFAIVAGGWGLKLIVFLVAIILLRGATWMNPAVFGVTLVVAAVALLVVDVVVLATARIPVVALPMRTPDGPAPRP